MKWLARNLREMGPTDIRAATAEDMADVHALCRAYRALLLERAAEKAQAVEVYYPLDAYEDLLARLPDIHRGPGGEILVATLDGSVVGCGMRTTPEPGMGELHRVFVAPEARGHGLGRRLCATLEAACKSAGLRSVRLETGAPLIEAITLYKSMGYEQVPLSYVPPEPLDTILIAFEKAL